MGKKSCKAFNKPKMSEKTKKNTSKQIVQNKKVHEKTPQL